jgi:hypothetical protein
MMCAAFEYFRLFRYSFLNLFFTFLIVAFIFGLFSIFFILKFYPILFKSDYFNIGAITFIIGFFIQRILFIINDLPIPQIKEFYEILFYYDDYFIYYNLSIGLFFFLFSLLFIILQKKYHFSNKIFYLLFSFIILVVALISYNFLFIPMGVLQ